MIIEEEDFKLTPVSDSSVLFDLELLYTIKGKNARKEFKVVAYGISLEYALKKIIQYRINNKLNSTTLKKYLEEFKTEINNIKYLCNGK